MPTDRVPSTARDGVRWLATATAAVVVTTLAVALRGAEGPRPVPLGLLGLSLATLGLVLERRTGRRVGGRRDPVPGTLLVVAAALLLLAAEAALRPDAAGIEPFLVVSGALFVGMGVVRDDRRPMAIGLLQWATAVGRPDGDTFRHCLVATDVAVPLPRVEPLVALGILALLAALLQRHRTWRVEAARGLENVGLALLLGGLAAKALELPGHRLLCGTGDAIDLGWALLFLLIAALVGLAGVAWNDRLWASSGLAAATLFGLAALVLEQNPLWGLLVGAPLVGILVMLEVQGVRWPRRTEAPLDPRPSLRQATTDDEEPAP